MTMVAAVPESPDRVVRAVAPPTDVTSYWDTLTHDMCRGKVIELV